MPYCTVFLARRHRSRHPRMPCNATDDAGDKRRPGLPTATLSSAELPDRVRMPIFPYLEIYQDCQSTCPQPI
eukprot:scaffold2120_cov169-Amphora_coffeaeformis.AAC.15